MNRTAVNPWDWSLSFGYNQAEVIEGAKRQVICAGQTAVDEHGARAICVRRSRWRLITWRPFWRVGHGAAERHALGRLYD